MGVKNVLWILLFVLVGFSGCKNKNGVEDNVEDNLVVHAEKATLVTDKKSIQVSGNIEGNKTVRLGFMVAGKINYIAAEEGETLKAGELLASLDPESYAIAKEIADANLNQMQDDYNRIKELYERKSVSESDYIKITNGLKAAKAQQRLQAKNLEDTKLYSPIKGVLLKKGVEAGEIIDKGLQLFAVSDIYKVKVIGSVPEMELQYMKIGNKADVFVASLDSTFTGKIIEIGTLADPATRTFSVKIELDNPDLLLRPGMTAEIRLETSHKTKYLAIPAQSILHDLDNSSYVFIADTAKNKAFKKIVSVGRISGEMIEITSGLTAGDLVITAGQNRLNNGSAIEIK